MDIEEYITRLGDWVLTSGLKIFFILILMMIAIRIAGILATKFFDLINRRESDSEYKKRVRTLSSVIRYILTIGIWVVSLMMILREFGIDIGPVIAAAGVVGLAVGFGAQNLVQDVISGFFLLLEDQIRVGDVVSINGKGGLVERITLRMVILRDLDGSVHYIRNGKIDTVTNLTKDHSYYVFDLHVSYRENIDEVIKTVQNIDEDMRKNSHLKDLILAPIEIFGIESFKDSSVLIKARVKTVPIRQWDVGREYNRKIKIKFDEKNIEIPFPHLTVYMGEDKKGNAPKLNVHLTPSEETSARKEKV